MGESIQIAFFYKGQDYSAVVNSEDGNEISYFVHYTKEPVRQFERIIEIYQLPDKTWLEMTDEANEIGADPEFIQTIGNAIIDGRVIRM